MATNLLSEEDIEGYLAASSLSLIGVFTWCHQIDKDQCLTGACTNLICGCISGWLQWDFRNWKGWDGVQKMTRVRQLSKALSEQATADNRITCAQ